MTTPTPRRSSRPSSTTPPSPTGSAASRTPARSARASSTGQDNAEHYHSGIALLTPADVHDGRAEQIVRKPPETLRLPEQGWINKPVDPKESPQHFPG